MPRLPKLFGRKHAADARDTLADEPSLVTAPDVDADLKPSDDTPDVEEAPDRAAEEPTVQRDASAGPDEAAAESPAPIATGSGDVVVRAEEAGPEHAGDAPAPTAAEEAPPLIPDPAPAPASVPLSDADRRPVESKTLIGGKEADLVPVIPDTEVEIPEATDLDDESIAAATIDALKGACEVMVGRVNTLRKMQDGSQIIAGMIALVSELDVRYASDWGIVRRNGLEEVLVEVRESVVEGDRFILESLENGRGGLTAEVFLRDLRTIAAADRPRMVAAYALFLVFVIKCVLRQYLRPLEDDPARLRDVTRRLDYLIDGIRDTLLARINGIPRMG